MQSIRVRIPQVHRINKVAPMAYCTPRNMSVFPRFFPSEFAQVARLLDDVSQFQIPRHSNSNNSYSNTFTGGVRSFKPRFDVKESKTAYELTGELPGVTDINVEFTDASTLTIKGRSTYSREEGTRPTGLLDNNNNSNTTEPTTETATEASETSSNYHKASVEADGEEDWVKTPEASVTEPSAPATESTVAPATETAAKPQQPSSESSKYWVSERSVGEFGRTFTFPARVDQEAVKASLKDGILSVTVPKAAPATKRINIE